MISGFAEKNAVICARILGEIICSSYHLPTRQLLFQMYLSLLPIARRSSGCLLQEERVSIRPSETIAEEE